METSWSVRLMIVAVLLAKVACKPLWKRSATFCNGDFVTCTVVLKYLSP